MIKVSKLLFITATFITELAKECGIKLSIVDCYQGKLILSIGFIGKMALSALEERSEISIQLIDDTDLSITTAKESNAKTIGMGG